MYFSTIYINPINVNVCMLLKYTDTQTYHEIYVFAHVHTHGVSAYFKLERLLHCLVIQRWTLNGHSIPCISVAYKVTYTLGILVCHEIAVGQEGT